MPLNWWPTASVATNRSGENWIDTYDWWIDRAANVAALSNVSRFIECTLCENTRRCSLLAGHKVGSTNQSHNTDDRRRKRVFIWHIWLELPSLSMEYFSNAVRLSICFVRLQRPVNSDEINNRHAIHMDVATWMIVRCAASIFDESNQSKPKMSTRFFCCCFV